MSRPPTLCKEKRLLWASTTTHQMKKEMFPLNAATEWWLLMMSKLTGQLRKNYLKSGALITIGAMIHDKWGAPDSARLCNRRDIYGERVAYQS
jgi:hypothetical protein